MDPEFVEKTMKAAGLIVVVSAPMGREAMAAAIDEGVARRDEGFIVVGGDGTLGLAVDTLLRHEWAEPPVLGVLPTGSGGDFIRTFALPRSLEGRRPHGWLAVIPTRWMLSASRDRLARGGP